MSNFRKKAIALAAVMCVALTSFASCSTSKSDSDKNNNTETTASADVQDASSDSNNGNSEGNNSGKSDDKEDNQNDKNENNVTPTLDHIDNENGQTIITPFQFGSPADLAKAGITLPGGDVDLDADDPVSNDNNGYQSKSDSRYCLWIDISKDTDYKFNGEFIEVYFKLKDNIPEKDYAVRFKTDFSSIEGTSLTPDKIIQGNIRVGGDIEAQDVSNESGFVAYGDNVSAKPGDEVCYRINLKNNPGMAAMLVWVHFDSNAMEVEDVIPAGEFADIAGSSATSGSKPKS